ncbi:MAG: class I SAM-dependent methyltransferase [Bacteroidales bacterium]
MNDRSFHDEFCTVERLRFQLLRNRSVYEMTDLGSLGDKNQSRNKDVSIRDVIKNSSVKPVYGRFLFRMARYFKPSVTLELGTSLGISTSYLSMGNPEGHITTVEGCPATAEIAAKNFKYLGLTNIDQIIGPFEKVLPDIFEKLGKIGLIFIDGNHRKEPVLHYFYQCLQHIHDDSVIIFDDIHWSKEMEEAWKVIRENPSVTVSIDLFRIGLVFFKEGLSKEDFILHF